MNDDKNNKKLIAIQITTGFMKLVKESLESEYLSVEEACKLTGISQKDFEAYSNGSKVMSVNDMATFSYHLNIGIECCW